MSHFQDKKKETSGQINRMKYNAKEGEVNI
jgi:hypothetical protein